MQLPAGHQPASAYQLGAHFASANFRPIWAQIVRRADMGGAHGGGRPVSGDQISGACRLGARTSGCAIHGSGAMRAGLTQSWHFLESAGAGALICSGVKPSGRSAKWVSGVLTMARAANRFWDASLASRSGRPGLRMPMSSSLALNGRPAFLGRFVGRKYFGLWRQRGKIAEQSARLYVGGGAQSSGGGARAGACLCGGRAGGRRARPRAAGPRADLVTRAPGPLAPTWGRPRSGARRAPIRDASAPTCAPIGPEINITGPRSTRVRPPTGTRCQAE